MAEIRMISPQEAKQLTEEGNGSYIDVRTVGEALVEQLPGSVFLPFDLVSRARLEHLGLAEKTPILVCRSGNRAKQAAESLSREMNNITVLDGGIQSWKKAGLPVEGGRKVVPLERQVLIAAGSMMLLFTLLGLFFSPYFFALTLFMACGLIFAGATGACGMARLLILMPWNKAPMCNSGCNVETSTQAT